MPIRSTSRRTRIRTVDPVAIPGDPLEDLAKVEVGCCLIELLGGCLGCAIPLVLAILLVLTHL